MTLRSQWQASRLAHVAGEGALPGPGSPLRSAPPGRAPAAAPPPPPLIAPPNPLHTTSETEARRGHANAHDRFPSAARGSRPEPGGSQEGARGGGWSRASRKREGLLSIRALATWLPWLRRGLSWRSRVCGSTNSFTCCDEAVSEIKVLVNGFHVEGKFCGLSHCPSSDSSEILSMDLRRSATSCSDSAPETSCLEWGRDTAS